MAPDIVSSEVRSKMMAAVKSKNTSPERAVRKRVFNEGFRYRLHKKNLPGSPDLSFPKYRIAVFVNGCFWHGHDCPKGRRPQTNPRFWNEKIEHNVARDRKAVFALAQAGWTVRVIWACELEKGVTSLLGVLRRRQRSGRFG